MTGRWCWSAAVFLVLASRVAAAQPAGEGSGAELAGPERTARARELFQQGAQLTRQGRWRDALGSFEASLELRPHSGTWYNIGFCERALGGYARARRAFLQALERNALEAGAELEPGLLADSKRYLAEVSDKLAKLRLTVQPTDVAIAVDGRPLEVVATQGPLPVLVAGTREPGAGEIPPGSAFELWVDPGNHVIVLSKGDAGRNVVDQSFREGQRGEIVLRWRPPPAPAPAAVEPEAVAASEVQRFWAIGLGVTGLAALAVGGVLGGVAAASWSDAQQACPDFERCPDDEGFELSNRARQAGNFATVAIATGVGALGGAAVLWFTAADPPQAQQEPASSRAVTVAPVAAPELVGVVLGGRF